MTLALLIAAAVAAVGDWVAVARRHRRLELGLKPLTLALLVAAAATAHLGPQRGLVVAALALGLAGDVALLLDRGGRDLRAFVAGLVAFLAGHVVYIVAFVHRGLHPVDVAAGALVVVGVGGLALPSLLRAALPTLAPGVALLVGFYTVVLAAMTVVAVGTGILLVAIGGVAFLASDTLLSRQRFVASARHGELAVIVTYHLAQGLLLLGLIRHF